MVSELTSADIAEWMAYERLEPFEREQANWRNALLCWHLTNLMTTEKTKISMDAFLLRFDRVYMGEEREKIVMESVQASTSKLKASAPKGAVTVYEGEAPAIRRIGKRGKPTKKKERLWRILGR